jgi:hypothetical protein
MAKVINFQTPLRNPALPKPGVTKTSQILRKNNPTNPNGGFDVSAIQTKNKVKRNIFNGNIKVKNKTRIDRNYNNPKTAQTQVSKTKTVYRKDGSEVRSKSK